MARRLGWFVGIAAFILVLARLGRVLDPAVDTPDWRLIVPAAAVGGVLMTWATARLSLVRQFAIHLAALTLLVLRVAAADTLTFGVVPTAATWPEFAERLGYALDIIRLGAPPVLAVTGLVALLSVAMWAMGSVWAASVVLDRPWTGLAPPMAFYLYLAVVDRGPSTLAWNVAFAAVAALSLIATSNVVPSGAGHLRSADNRPLPRWQAGPSGRIALGAALAGLVGVSVLGTFVPAGGAIDWRSPGGEGTGLGDGGFSAGRFVGLRQSIVSLSEEPVFLASVEPEAPEGPNGYWRLLTLDRFNGLEWTTGDQDFGDVAPGAVDSPASTTAEIVQTIQIESLSDDRLPSLFYPTGLVSSDPVIRSGTTIAPDGNLRLNALTFDGLTYRVESQVPELEMGLLASEGGELTPLFDDAVSSGEILVDPAEGDAPPRPPEISSYLTLPAIDPAVGALTQEVTAMASSPFEQALMLEDFLRTFDYSTNVSTGHSALDLAAWLTDPESRNYRTGYCEQFATAMAVMGRILGLPTRVAIGFTNGEVADTPDGPLTVVRERNAHAWVEVWFDGQGWVGFDPTPRTDGATSPLTETLGVDPSDLEDTGLVGEGGVTGQIPDFIGDPGDIPVDIREGTGAGREGIGLALPAAVAVIVALAAALPAVKAWRTGRRLRRARAGDVAAVWEEITDRLTDLGAGPARHQTPIEFARGTSVDLMPLAEAYTAAVYGGYQPGDVERHLEDAGRWLEESFDQRDRTRAVFSIRSLRR